MTTEECRAELIEAVEQHEREFEVAVAQLKGAVQRPFGLVTRVREHLGTHPLSWMLSALLVGVWLGARHGAQEDP